MNAQALLGLVPFYIIGAFPTGTLLARLRGVDLKNVGSGNVGATNVTRALGKKAGLITLFVDVLKGGLAAGLAFTLSGSEYFAGAAAVAAVLGHCFSIPGKLRGGKGVATALGAIAYIAPTAAFGAVAVFAVFLVIFRVVSLASIGAAISTPIILMVTGAHADSLGAMVVIAIIITVRHRQNLARLIHGKEPRLKST